jgi:hypothetical protein
MWIYPVDLKLLFAALGNLYIGYEGTPGGLWQMMQLGSLFILGASFWTWQFLGLRKILSLLYIWAAIPLALVIAISFIKPIYVHRYVIFVTVAEVMLVGYFIFNLKRQFLRYVVGLVIFSFTLYINFYMAPYHRKIDIRTPLKEILPRLKNGDLVYAQTPLVFYETRYYAAPHQVYLYNPYRIIPPRYVGAGGMPETVWATSIPTYPARAYIVQENGKVKIESQFSKK